MTRHHDTTEGNLRLSVRGGRVQDDVANNMCMDGRLFHFPFLPSFVYVLSSYFRLLITTPPFGIILLSITTRREREFDF